MDSRCLQIPAQYLLSGEAPAPGRSSTSCGRHRRPVSGRRGDRRRRGAADVQRGPCRYRVRRAMADRTRDRPGTVSGSDAVREATAVRGDPDRARGGRGLRAGRRRRPPSERAQPVFARPASPESSPRTGGPGPAFARDLPAGRPGGDRRRLDHLHLRLHRDTGKAAVTHRNAAALVDAEARMFLQDSPDRARRPGAGRSVGGIRRVVREMRLAWRNGAARCPPCARWCTAAWTWGPG